MGVNGVRDIVGIRKGTHRGVRKRGLASLAVLGAAVIAGLLAAWGASPVESSGISPADVVALRFPPDWMGDEETTGAAPAAPATFALASASEQRLPDTGTLFSPYQAFPQPVAAAYAPQSRSLTAPANGPAPDLRPALRPDAKPDANKPAVATVRTAPAPERKPAARARKDSGALFNDAQLASIKGRLKLSEYQEQYWPPVESALRAIGWRASHEGSARKSSPRGSETRLAEIDPESAEVQQLKSAAFPLIMSMNDDQKQQVRMLAHVMGLERVASSF